MINLIKSLANVFNLFIFLALLTAVFYFLKKNKTAKALLYINLLLLLLFSTGFLPKFLAHQLEKNFTSLDSSSVKKINRKFFIHVLGSGYSADEKAPANVQLGTTALARLSEGVRLMRLNDSAVLVCSGGPMENRMENDTTTQAGVTKEAAIILGIEPKRIELLNTPTTTQEEALDLVQKFGKDIKLFIVTDAIHMPRAMQCFRNAGIKNITPASAIFQSIGTYKERKTRWWPALENLNLSNQVFHEYLGNLKLYITSN